MSDSTPATAASDDENTELDLDYTGWNRPTTTVAPWWLLECAHYSDYVPDDQMRVFCAVCSKGRRRVMTLTEAATIERTP